MLRIEDIPSAEGRIYYATTLAPAEAAAALTSLVASDEWRKAPDLWIQRAGWLAQTHAEGMACLLALSLKLRKKPLDDHGHRVLQGLFLGLRKDEQEIANLTEWLVTTPDPGRSAIIAELVNNLWSPIQTVDTKASIFALCRWLREHGAAELRARASLLPAVLEGAMAERGEAVPLVLRLIATAEGAQIGQLMVKSQPVLLDACEAALGSGASWSLITDLAERCGFLIQSLRAPERPLTRLALLRGLTEGRLHGTLRGSGWSTAFSVAPPASPPSFATAEELAAAVAHFQFTLSFPEAAIHAEWATFLAREVLRIHDPLSTGGWRSARAELSQLHRNGVGEEEVSNVLLDALRSANDNSLQVARQILQDGPAGYARLNAALCELPDAPRNAPEYRESRLSLLEKEFTKVLNKPWVEPVFGVSVSELTKGARRIAFEKLTDDDKIRVVAGDVILLEKEVYESIDAKVEDTERFFALSIIYLLHELTHVGQGIGHMDAVKTLRSTGGETTLLHFDLAADWAAVLLTSNAFPRWSLAELRDMQGRSLVKYPSSWLHPLEARTRKASRLVALRLDYLARQDTGHKLDTGGGYLFADFGPAGGEFVVMRSGPPPAVLHAAKLTKKAALVLSACSDAGRGSAEDIDELDGVLRDLLSTP